MTNSQSEFPLQPAGVSMLLVYGAKLTPPSNGKPGIAVTVDKNGALLLEAVGYSKSSDAINAIREAAQVCVDADLVVTMVPTQVRTRGPARIVRRRQR